MQVEVEVHGTTATTGPGTGSGSGTGSLCPKLWPTKPVANQGHDKAAVSASISSSWWSGALIAGWRLTSPVILASKVRPVWQGNRWGRMRSGHVIECAWVLKALLLLLLSTATYLLSHSSQVEEEISRARLRNWASILVRLQQRPVLHRAWPAMSREGMRMSYCCQPMLYSKLNMTVSSCQTEVFDSRTCTGRPFVHPEFKLSAPLKANETLS